MGAAIKTVQDEMRDANERLQAMVALATTEDRDFTEDEVKEKDALVARMTALDGKRKRGESFDQLLASVGKLAPPAAAAPNGNGHGAPSVIVPPRKSWGEQFVASAEYQSLRAAPRTGKWQTPVVELLGAVTITPDYPTPPPAGLPIVAPLNYPADWGIAGLFAQGTVDGGLIQYLQEKVWTNNAAPVAVGAAKPESHKEFELKQQGLIKLAHWIPVPDEFLEDISGLQSLIDAQMRNGIIEVLNDELVNGTGAGHFTGLIGLTGKTPTIAAGTGVGEAAAAIAAQRAQIYQLSRLRPDAVVMNPLTWAGLSSQMSTAGGYLAGPNTFGAGVPPQVWGLRVVETPEVPDGTAILGAFRQGGQLFTKGGVSVQATNSHDDFFIKNITAIRAEMRAALAIYRPLAFGLVEDLPVASVTPPAA